MFKKRQVDAATAERREKLRTCCRQLAAFLFSHIGLCALVVGYSIMGAATFQALEGQNEINKRLEVKHLRDATVADLWNMTMRFNVLWKENWTTEAGIYLQRFQTEVIAKVKQGYDGKDENDAREQWSFSGAFLYSLTVITTI
ncbi:PREDICTED: two pore potassium channel protein sup-9-like, partial [Priapulus caudatus]|uniref:Two pore potassium channel protein sup-9-like n=1 Tax=Priapulus caudatus TaxID=37621 RepID=A0ABM1EN35_PRICU